MNPILLVVLGTLALGFAEASSSRQLKKYHNVTSVGLILVGTIVTIILSLVWNLIFKIEFAPISLQTLCIAAVIVGVAYFANKFFYSSYKTEQASTVSVLMMFSIVVSVILGKVLFAERISPLAWLGIFIVIIAVFRINVGSFSLKKIKEVFAPNSAKLYALTGSSLLGISFGLSKFIVQDLNPHYYQFIDVLIAFPIYLLLDFKAVSSQIKVVSKMNIFWNFAPIILLYFIYNKLRYIAFSLDIPLPVADAVDNTVVFVILGVEFFIFRIKENNYVEKLLLSLLAFAGVMLIGIG